MRFPAATHGRSWSPKGFKYHLNVDPRETADQVEHKMPSQTTNPFSFPWRIAWMASLSDVTRRCGIRSRGSKWILRTSLDPQKSNTSIWESFLVYSEVEPNQILIIFCGGYSWSLELSSTKPEVLLMSKTVPSPQAYPARLWSAISIHVEPNPASATHVVAVRDPAKNSMNWKSSGPESIPWWIDPFNINDFSGGRKIRGIFSCMPWSLLKYFTWCFLKWF